MLIYIYNIDIQKCSCIHYTNPHSPFPHSPFTHPPFPGTAALVNYPLWRSSVIRQSGYLPSTASTLELYSHAFKPPYKGVVTVIGGMTWARAGIFFGSDKIKGFFEERGIKGGQGERGGREIEVKRRGGWEMGVDHNTR